MLWSVPLNADFLVIDNSSTTTFAFVAKSVQCVVTNIYGVGDNDSTFTTGSDPFTTVVSVIYLNTDNQTVQVLEVSVSNDVYTVGTSATTLFTASSNSNTIQLTGIHLKSVNVVLVNDSTNLMIYNKSTTTGSWSKLLTFSLATDFGFDSSVTYSLIQVFQKRTIVFSSSTTI